MICYKLFQRFQLFHFHHDELRFGAYQCSSLADNVIHSFVGLEDLPLVTRRGLGVIQRMSRIKETPEVTILSRCSYSPSEGRESCDQYTVDHTVFDTNASIKKYYVFRSHFDVQLFSDLTMLENNGRGTVALGKCVVVSP